MRSKIPDRESVHEENLADGGRIEVWPNWLAPALQRRYFDEMRAELPWRQEHIKLFGKEMAQPRLSAWVGDPDAVYVYSGLVNRPQPWTATMAELRQRLDQQLGHSFNSVLANLYRDHRDSMGWHADNEPELGPTPIIASLSLGATRRFALRHKHRRDLRRQYLLESGSLLIMSGTLQQFWKHSVPKERATSGARINLTFRHVIPLQRFDADRDSDPVTSGNEP